MKKTFLTALLTLPLLAAPVWADGFGIRFGINGTLTGNLAPICGGHGCGSPCNPLCSPCGAPGGGLGPWYGYFPYDQHFQAPAMPQYPYWPGPQAMYQGQMGPAQAMPHGGPVVYGSQQPYYFAGAYGQQPYQYAGASGQQPYGYSAPAYPYQGPYQTVGYQYQAPAYWYGR
jgi:hypothetical protein